MGLVGHKGWPGRLPAVALRLVSAAPVQAFLHGWLPVGLFAPLPTPPPPPFPLPPHHSPHRHWQCAVLLRRWWAWGGVRGRLVYALRSSSVPAKVGEGACGRHLSPREQQAGGVCRRGLHRPLFCGAPLRVAVVAAIVACSAGLRPHRYYHRAVVAGPVLGGVWRGDGAPCCGGSLYCVCPPRRCLLLVWGGATSLRDSPLSRCGGARPAARLVVPPSGPARCGSEGAAPR